MITPQQKIQLFRQATSNPGAAFLAALDILTKEMDSRVNAEISKFKNDQQSIVDEAVKNSMPNLDTILHMITGEDGEDADPEEVAQLILETPGFSEMAKGNPGEPGSPGKPGKPGRDGTNYVLTGNDKKAIAKSIKVPVVKQIIEKTVVEKPINIIKEKAVADKPAVIAKKLNETEQSVNPQVIQGLVKFMNDVRNAMRAKSAGGKSSRRIGGGGDIVSAGSNITITTDANGRKVISSTGGSGGSSQVEDLTSQVTSGNDSYTPTYIPTFIVLDTLSYMEGHGYTFSGNTITLDPSVASLVLSNSILWTVNNGVLAAPSGNLTDDSLNILTDDLGDPLTPL